DGRWAERQVVSGRAAAAGVRRRHRAGVRWTSLAGVLFRRRRARQWHIASRWSDVPVEGDRGHAGVAADRAAVPTGHLRRGDWTARNGARGSAERAPLLRRSVPAVAALC